MSRLERFAEVTREKGLFSAFRQIPTAFYNVYLRAVWDRKQRDSLRWKEAYRYQYDISSDDVIFDIGGYRGGFTERLLADHSPGTIHVFEPVSTFAEAIRTKFSDEEGVVVHEYGLKDANQTEQFEVDDNSSSLFTDEPNAEVQTRDVVEVIDDLGVEEIRLMKINVEGAEYSLLDRLLESGYVSRVNNIQVQFHDFPEIENAEEQHATLQSRLEETHELTWEFYFMWENWSRRSTA